MSERDVVQEAARALREAHGGAKLGAGFTRGRIMQTLHERRRRRISLRVTLGPLLAVLVAGTAWAQVTGQLPELWQQAVEFLVPFNAPTATLTAVPQPAAVSNATRGSNTNGSNTNGGGTSSAVANGGAMNGDAASDSSTQETEPELPLPAVSAEEAVSEASRVEAQPVASSASRAEAPARPRRARAATAQVAATDPAAESSMAGAAAVAASVELAKDPELALFREGHELHFRGGSPMQAIAAYERYLERYPRGRFVPEARYNIAIDWLKQGEPQRAKALLSAFARGDYGGYRQEEARKLLATLP